MPMTRGEVVDLFVEGASNRPHSYIVSPTTEFWHDFRIMVPEHGGYMGKYRRSLN